MEKRWGKRRYLNYLMHEFISTPLLNQSQKEALLETIGGFGVIPRGVVDFRLHCLRGENPERPYALFSIPKEVFDYPPPHWGSIAPTGLGFASWTYPPIEGGREKVIETKIDSPEDWVCRKEDEIRSMIRTIGRQAKSYPASGGNRLYPEYSIRYDALRARVKMYRKALRMKLERQRNRVRKAA